MKRGLSSTFDKTISIIPHPSVSHTVWFSGISVSKPTIESSKISKNVLVYPAECRERGMTYRGKIQAKFCWRVNDAEVQSEIKTLGHLPVIVRVRRMHHTFFLILLINSYFKERKMQPRGQVSTGAGGETRRSGRVWWILHHQWYRAFSPAAHCASSKSRLGSDSSFIHETRAALHPLWRSNSFCSPRSVFSNMRSSLL